MRAGDHSDLHNAGWNKDWKQWCDDFLDANNGKSPGIDDAKKYIKEIMNKHKYKCINDRGFKAAWSHSAWLGKLGRIKQKIAAKLATKLTAITGKTLAKKGTRGIIASIPIVSIGFSLYDYPARAAEFGGGVAFEMSIIDNLPIVDLALAGAETIDAIQQERLKAERESRDEEARLFEELVQEAKEAGEGCNDVEEGAFVLRT